MGLGGHASIINILLLLVFDSIAENSVVIQICELQEKMSLY